MELEHEYLLRLYPGYDTVLGPYSRPDGREHIVLNNSTASKGEKGKTRTISYPRALVEHIIGRRLSPTEEVDHKDGDKLNNDFNNYEVITGTANRKKQYEEGNNKLWGTR